MSDITILLVDDHAIVREGMHRILERQPGLRVVGEACDGIEALELAEKLVPDVVVMDLNLPRLDGIEATRAITSRCPSVRVLVLTIEKSDATVMEAIRAGAWGYVLKESRSKQLVEAIRAVHSGGVGMDSAMAGRLVMEFRRSAKDPPSGPFDSLNEREMQMLESLSTGATNRQIAVQLELAEQTIKNGLSAIYQKLGVKNRVEAATAFRKLASAKRRP